MSIRAFAPNARATRSEAAIAAAKAERLGVPSGEPSPLVGPLVPLKAQAAGQAAVFVIMTVALGLRTVLADGTFVPPTLALAGAAAVMIATASLAVWESSRRFPTEPLPESQPRRDHKGTFLSTAGWQAMAMAYGVLLAAGFPADRWFVLLFAALTASGVIGSSIQIVAISEREREVGSTLYGLRVRGRERRRCFARLAPAVADEPGNAVA